jgi:hypothetical protein
MFSGRQPRQGVEVLRRSYQAVSNTLKMGTELVPETSENFRTFIMRSLMNSVAVKASCLTSMSAFLMTQD